MLEPIVGQEESPWTTFSSASGLPSRDVFSIAASHGEVWAGMKDVVARFEPANSSWVSMNPPDLQSRVTCIAIGEDDVWFGTYGNGLLRYRSGEWSSYTKKDGLADDRVEDLEIFGAYMYVATVGGAGRISLGGEALSFTNVGKAEGLPEQSLSAVSVLKGMVWFGTKANGIVGLDLESFTYKKQVTIIDGLSDSRVLALDADEEFLWVGTGAGGLCQYNPENGSVTIYNKSLGLADNLVGSVASNSNIWTGSWGAGVTRIERDGTMMIYDRSDGLAAGDVRDIAVDGEYVWFATVGGGSPTAGGVGRFRGEIPGGGKIPIIYVLIAVLIVAAVAVPVLLRERSTRKTEGPRKQRPYQMCGGKPSNNLCPFCRYNILRGGKHHCSKYQVRIPFEDES